MALYLNPSFNKLVLINSLKSNLRLKIPLSGIFGNSAFTVAPLVNKCCPALLSNLPPVVENTPLALILSCDPPAVNTISFGLVSSILSSVEISLMTFLAIASIASSCACSSSFPFAA